jgi:hypothetical protein
VVACGIDRHQDIQVNKARGIDADVSCGRLAVVFLGAKFCPMEFEWWRDRRLFISQVITLPLAVMR